MQLNSKQINLFNYQYEFDSIYILLTIKNNLNTWLFLHHNA